MKFHKGDYVKIFDEFENKTFYGIIKGYNYGNSCYNINWLEGEPGWYSRKERCSPNEIECLKRKNNIIIKITMWKIVKALIYLTITIKLVEWFLYFNQSNLENIWKTIQTIMW